MFISHCIGLLLRMAVKRELYQKVGKENTDNGNEVFEKSQRGTLRDRTRRRLGETININFHLYTVDNSKPVKRIS